MKTLFELFEAEWGSYLTDAEIEKIIKSILKK